MPAMGAVANDDLDEFAQWRSGSTGSPTKSTTIVGVDASSTVTSTGAVEEVAETALSDR